MQTILGIYFDIGITCGQKIRVSSDCKLGHIKGTHAMELMTSLIALVLFCAIGVAGIYFLVDFFEYLKKHHIILWNTISFESPFGIPQKDFYFYPIRPFRFIPFLFSPDEMEDSNVAGYKMRIKLSVLGILIVAFFSLLQ